MTLNNNSQHQQSKQKASDLQKAAEAKTNFVDIVNLVRDMFKAVHEPVKAFLSYSLKSLFALLGSLACRFKLIRCFLSFGFDSFQSVNKISKTTVTWLLTKPKTDLATSISTSRQNMVVF